MQFIAWISGLIALIAGASYGTLSAVNERPPEPSRSADILVGGDMMFDRYIRKMMRVHGDDHPLSCVKEVLAEADLVVANLEGPVTTHPSMSEGSVVGSAENYTFTFAPDVVPMLRRHNIGLVNIGNNHIMNFGRDGLMQTHAFLDEGGIRHFGSPATEDGVARLEIGAMPFSFVSWSEWTGPDADTVVAQVAHEHAAGQVVIVYAHWGDEYVAPPERVKRLARRFAENGAAIVIGSHPHIVQEREDHGGVPIYYSLGNLVFDQYWEDAVRDGLILRLRFSDGILSSIDELPTRLERDGRVCPR